MLHSLKDRFGFSSGPLGNSQDKPLLHPTEWPDISRSASQPGTNYGFFTRLPLEIRQHILGKAFGDRTLHIDLTFDHPLTRKSRPKKDHATSPRKHCGFETELVRNTYRSKRWQWFGCVCHRRLIRPNQDRGSSRGRARIEPCEDSCFPRSDVPKPTGERDDPHLFYSCPPHREDCFIGAMGWLLTCRQACADSFSFVTFMSC